MKTPGTLMPRGERAVLGARTGWGGREHTPSSQAGHDPQGSWHPVMERTAYGRC